MLNVLTLKSVNMLTLLYALLVLGLAVPLALGQGKKLVLLLGYHAHWQY